MTLIYGQPPLERYTAGHLLFQKAREGNLERVWIKRRGREGGGSWHSGLRVQILEESPGEKSGVREAR